MNDNANKRALPSERDSYFGLTKREYFAGLAMQGLVAGFANSVNYTVNDGWPHAESIVKTSLQIADELLKQLNP